MSILARLIRDACLGVVLATAAGIVNAQQSIEEIVVTAARREQSLQDVPMAVTALDTATLEQRGITEYANYLATVPGAALVDANGFGGEIKFRGVGPGTNALQSPTTAVYLGEVPIVHSGRNVNSSYNFWLVDLERVEVLRGPQGQLFGSNSLGGAIRNIPVQPKLDRFDMRANIGGTSTEDGSLGFNGDLMLNVPLIDDRLGARLVVYTNRDSGWYDNAFSGGPTMASLAAPGVASPYIAVAGFYPGPIAAPPGSTLPAVNVVLVPAPPGPPSFIPGGPPGVLGIHPDPAAAAAYAAPQVGGTRNTNETDTNGGRLILSWHPIDRLRADLMIAIEDKDTPGAAYAEYIPATSPDPFGGPPRQNYGSTTDYRDYQHFDAAQAGTSDHLDLYNLVLEYNFDSAALTSSTSYWQREEVLSSDLSISSIRITGVTDTVPIVSQRWDKPDVWTQELRMTSNDKDSRIDWLAGFFYQDISQDHRVLGIDRSGLNLRYWTDVVLSGIPGPFSPPAPTTTTLADNQGHYNDQQTAFFGQIGYDLTSTLHAAASFRWLHLDQSLNSVSTGFQFGSALGSQSGNNTDQIFTPRFELSWQPEDEQLYYLSATEGYRTGVINTELPLGNCGTELANAGFPGGIPPTKPDTLWSYELGSKFRLFDQRLQVNAALFYIDWSNVQQTFVLSAFNPGGSGASQCTYPAVANFGSATSIGAELELSALVTDQLRVEWSFSYVNATFDETINTPTKPLVSKNDSMPFTPDVTSFLALNYSFRLGSRPLWGRVEWQYVGEKQPLPLDLDPANYTADLPFRIGDYNQVNLRGGIDITDKLRAEIFATNLFNEYGVTSAGDTGGFGFPILTTTRPRTAGVTMRWRF